LLFVVTGITNGQSGIDKKMKALKAGFLSLDGQVSLKGNPVDANGTIHQFNSPVLHLERTKSKSPKGAVLLLPGGGYELLKLKNEGEEVASFLNAEGFDVGILEYHIGTGSGIRSLALSDALKAFRLLKTGQSNIGFHGDRLVIMGLSSGGHLAARTVQRLGEKEQPNDVILISPTNLNEPLTGTVYPAVMPPVQPTARLFSSFSANENKEWMKSCQEYTKTWKGYDGLASFHLLPDSVSVADKDANPVDPKLAGLLKTFLEEKPAVAASGLNPATVPVQGYATKRHAEKLALVAKEKFDLIMIGNSITNNFEKPEYQPVWNQFFAPRKALNLGYSGYRTENIIWNIQNGQIDGQSPKVIVLEIGTNNIDEKNYPTRHTSGQLAGGIEVIMRLLRERCPDSKIIVLRCFPGYYGGPNPTSHRAILERASDIVSSRVDRKHVFYCDVNHVFLNLDGSIKHDMMPDWLHPSPAGAKAWAQAMEPLLSELMGDKSLDTEIPANSAIVPASKLENDFYNWWDRHAEVLRIKDSINPEIVLIGNSITHMWGGEPTMKNIDGKPRIPNGPKTWASLFGNYRVLNLGFGWDRTQNVLWRLDHGELDGLHPRIVIINIGTNNTSQTQNARMNTAPEIVEGIKAICQRVRSKAPGAKIILMAIMPREQSPTHPRRILINEINQKLIPFAKENNITLVDIGPKMLALDGILPKDIASDFCHPTEKGYQIWADGIRSIISEP
jgi:lysophospholipase L1-like esterase/acetyl esterase/lipase